MKINPKVVKVVGWVFGFILLMAAATYVSVQEVQENRDIVLDNRARLDHIGQELDELRLALDRIEAELKEIVVMRGTASWYGPGFNGRKAANGSLFNMNAFTLAHRELPLGSWVAITNDANGRTAFGIVTDRGPYVPGRDFDVSLALAKELGFDRKGLTYVTVRVLKVI